MFDKLKEFFIKLFKKIRYKIKGTKLYKVIFDKQTDSHLVKKFLKNVANGKYTENKNIKYAYFDINDNLNAISLAIDEGYVRNMSLSFDSEEIFPELDASFPSVTISGENFLRNQAFFNRHPFLEKVVIALVSSIITLLIGYFSK